MGILATAGKCAIELLENCSPEMIHEAFLMVTGDDVDIEKVKKWTYEQRYNVRYWLRQYMLRASDNIVRVPPRPECVKEVLSD